MSKGSINIDNLDAIISDFDGVLTDNRVYINSNGEEFVGCNRSDGLALDVLRYIGSGLITLLISIE